METALRRAALLAPLAATAVLAAPVALLVLLAAAEARPEVAFGVLAMYLWVFVVLIIPLAYLVLGVLLLIARASGVDPSVARAQSIALVTVAVVIVVGFGMRWLAGNGAPWWVPLTGVPAALGGVALFVRLRRGEARGRLTAVGD